MQSSGADVDEEEDGLGILGDGISGCRTTSSSAVRVGIKEQNSDAAVPLVDMIKHLQHVEFTHATPRSRMPRKM